LILIDCGAYYEGGLATDITRVFVKGNPSDLQRKVYTTVLKAFLNAYNTQIKDGLSGFDIDCSVRKFFSDNSIDGFVFNHGLGHGIGINVHEAPPNLGCNYIAKTPLKNNMCFTIEPGLYNKDYFGVRLENSCYLKNNKICSFVKMNYEKKLINYSMLTEQEKFWLNEFEVI
jgi:Xaa-Pro aminopeptidase